jgi:hypothetical protein
MGFVWLGLLLNGEIKNGNKELCAVLGVLLGIFAIVILSVLPNLPGESIEV